MFLRYAQFWFMRKGSGTSCSITFCIWFFEKNISRVLFYELFKFHCPVAFTFWVIGQYVYCNCFPVCDVTTSDINLGLSSHFSTWPKKLEQKFKHLQNEKSFSGEIKIFHRSAPFKSKVKFNEKAQKQPSGGVPWKKMFFEISQSS